MNTLSYVPEIIHDLDSERYALGAVILQAEDGGDYQKLLSQLAAHLFVDLRCRGVFETARAIVRAGMPPTRQELLRRAQEHGNLEELGGRAFILSGLDDGAFVADFDVHLKRLREHHVRRQVMIFGQQLVCGARDPAVDVSRQQKELERFSLQVGMDLKIGNEPRLKVWTPQALRRYELPADSVLVGDRHITKGGVFAIGGHPGVGKSRAATHLARCGALGRGDWLGFTIHRPFRTFILQNENGMHRLKEEYGELHEFEDSIRVSSPPPLGMQFSDPGFRNEISFLIADFKPDLILLDPWNAITRGDKQPDYLEALHFVREAIPQGPEAPALGIVCHTKKPSGDRKRGRALLHELSGSHVLGSVARSVFALEAASDDTEDDRVVFTCAKNNDGALGVRSAWHRQANRFTPCPDFNWNEFDGADAGGSKKEVTEGDIREVLVGKGDGQARRVKRKVLQEELVEVTKLGRTKVYDEINRLIEKGVLVEDEYELLYLRD
jgi:hypothetical protein